MHGVDTAAIGIEAIAIAGLVVGACGTAGSTTSADSAVISVRPAGLILKFHGAIGSSMGGDLVGRGHVNALDDVELSMSRPGRVAESPEGRPDATNRTGHVFDVGEKETMVVVDFAFKTYRLATSRVGIEHIGVVHAPFGGVACTKSKNTAADGCCLVYILNKTMSGVRVREEVEAVVEIASGICILQRIGVRDSRSAQRKESKQKATRTNKPRARHFSVAETTDLTTNEWLCQKKWQAKREQNSKAKKKSLRPTKKHIQG